jgi:hypothetical protein
LPYYIIHCLFIVPSYFFIYNTVLYHCHLHTSFHSSHFFFSSYSPNAIDIYDKIANSYCHLHFQLITRLHTHIDPQLKCLYNSPCTITLCIKALALYTIVHTYNMPQNSSIIYLQYHRIYAELLLLV